MSKRHRNNWLKDSCITPSKQLETKTVKINAFWWWFCASKLNVKTATKCLLNVDAIAPQKRLSNCTVRNKVFLWHFCGSKTNVKVPAKLLLTAIGLYHKNDCNYTMSEISCFCGVFATPKLMSIHQQKACFAKLQMRTNDDFKPTLSRMRWSGSVLVLVKHLLNTSATRAKRWRNCTW